MGPAAGGHQDVEFGVDELAAPLGSLAPGSYGLLARAWNDDCEIVAAVCRAITVEAGGSETLTIQMLGRGGQRCAWGSASGSDQTLNLDGQGDVSETAVEANLSGSTISPNGEWAAYALIAPESGSEKEMRIYRIRTRDPI